MCGNVRTSFTTISFQKLCMHFKIYACISKAMHAFQMRFKWISNAFQPCHSLAYTRLPLSRKLRDAPLSTRGWRLRWIILFVSYSLATLVQAIVFGLNLYSSQNCDAACGERVGPWLTNTILHKREVRFKRDCYRNTHDDNVDGDLTNDKDDDGPATTNGSHQWWPLADERPTKRKTMIDGAHDACEHIFVTTT